MNKTTSTNRTTSSNKGLVATAVIVLILAFLLVFVISFRSDIISFFNKKYNLSINESKIEAFLNNDKSNGVLKISHLPYSTKVSPQFNFSTTPIFLKYFLTLSIQLCYNSSDKK